ncbi:hypothetical protein [Microbacterium sp. MPKO10]|uniref:hypothetical protein n=1 Tax=Microbacterium sp. MPKO10 TaxID=2989818 RepID=UPI002235AE86|nr:hypothetical protein [Microbacterium sp. MPKO10]MCW4457586.1 hypothetical protein [Microbacterium sp. MPKO10]
MLRDAGQPVNSQGLDAVADNTLSLTRLYRDAVARTALPHKAQRTDPMPDRTLLARGVARVADVNMASALHHLSGQKRATAAFGRRSSLRL